MRRFLYFEADGDGTNCLAVPVERVAGIDVTSATAFSIYFDSIGGGGADTADQHSGDVAISNVTSGDCKLVVEAIAEAMLHSTDPFIVVLDAQNAEAIHSSMTATAGSCAITLDD